MKSNKTVSWQSLCDACARIQGYPDDIDAMPGLLYLRSPRLHALADVPSHDKRLLNGYSIGVEIPSSVIRNFWFGYEYFQVHDLRLFSAHDHASIVFSKVIYADLYSCQFLSGDCSCSNSFERAFREMPVARASEPPTIGLSAVERTKLLLDRKLLRDALIAGNSSIALKIGEAAGMILEVEALNRVLKEPRGHDFLVDLMSKKFCFNFSAPGRGSYGIFSGRRKLRAIRRLGSYTWRANLPGATFDVDLRVIAKSS